MGIVTTYYLFIGQEASPAIKAELIELMMEDEEFEESYWNSQPLLQHENETYFYMVDMGGHEYIYKCFYYIGESDEQSRLVVDYDKIPKDIEEPCKFYCFPIMT